MPNFLNFSGQTFFNITSIKKAIILSSGSKIREFVQRRGRILRLHPTKTKSEIIDFIVCKNGVMLPNEEKRYKEYASLSIEGEKWIYKSQMKN